MRWGCCGTFEDASAIRSAGFDFLEVNVQQVLRGTEPDDVWAARLPDVEALGLPIEAANCLVPGDLPVVGPGRDMTLLKTYLQRVAQRARRLGIGVLVFGSGAARNRPEGVSVQQADRQLAEFTTLAADACAAHDVLLTIEHLHRQECNTLNTLGQLNELLAHVDHPHAAALLDTFHYGEEKQSLSDITALGERLRHVHVAEPVGRHQPGVHGGPSQCPDAFDFVAVFRVLRQIGYTGRISVEAIWRGDLADTAPVCLEVLRYAWDRAATP